ncbi:hypothetical protein LUZ63_009265 [Rhynchospora breviuscula]|uniref:Uncharacterized protein n=1 Tax=Rhynchospora breviuscula TaxID=2022672 RepID=A0A9Q0CEP6_9POAL|nr:hypothetical protein LUZ63_009265 [Rhynchospora breviuscula]
MIPGFNRSITFPMTQWPKKRAAYHVRSVSLPCESRPFIANLKEKLVVVQSWAAGTDTSLASIEAGLSHIELLLLDVSEFLNLSETKTVLQHAAASTECLLETFLYLVDSYGSLQSEMVAVKQHYFEVQSALRTHDSALVVSSLKSQRRLEKELSHLAATLRATTKTLHLGLSSNASEAEIIEVVKEAIGATSAASVVLLNRVAAVLAASSSAAASMASYTVWPFKMRSRNEEREMLYHVKFEELEGCIDMVERGTESALRSLVNSRVLLLNIQSGLL